MQFLSLAVTTLLAVAVQAAPVPEAEPQFNVCFDDFDCFGKGSCVSNMCTGTSTGGGTPTPTTSGAAGGLPGFGGFSGLPFSIPTDFSNVCFDDFDCFGKGSCVSGKCSGAASGGSGSGFGLPSGLPSFGKE